MNVLESLVVEFDLIAKTFVHKSIWDLDEKLPPDKIYWIHCNTAHPDDLNFLTERLHLDRDLLKLTSSKYRELMPKLLETPSSVSFRIQYFSAADTKKRKKADLLKDLVVHITQQYCMTITNSHIPAIQTLNDSFYKNLLYGQTPGFLLFLLCDNIINDYSNTLFQFELDYEKLNFTATMDDSNIYSDVTLKKQELITVTQYIVAFRGILMRLSGRRIAVISEQCRMALIPVMEHTQIILSESTAIREMLSGILDEIDNKIMYNMSNTMKVLTAFSSIFLPLTLISSIYGMNFKWIPELDWHYGYFFAIGLMLFIGVMLALIFRRMKMF